VHSRSISILALVGTLAACAPSSDPTARVELRKVTGDTVQIVPAAGSLPYCLVFTHSAKVTRQLTISKSNQSVKCPAGQPVLGQTYRIPAEEGPVKIQVFLSDQRLEAVSVASQLTEMDQPSFNPIDMRLPGKVVVQSIPFTPVASAEPTTGALVPGGTLPAASNAPPNGAARTQ
jgi:hypothetical protein